MDWSVLLFCFVLPSLGLMLIALRLEDVRRRNEAEKTNQTQIETIKRFRLANENITASLDSSVLLPQIAEQMCNAARTTSAYICNFDGAETYTTVAEYFSPFASEKERVSDMGMTYIENDETYLTDFKAGRPSFSHISDLDLTDSEREHMLQYGAKSILYIPLQVRGTKFNHIELWESRYHRELSDVDIVLIQSIAQQAVIALDNAHLHEQMQAEIEKRRHAEADIRDKAAELAVLVDIANAVSMIQTMDEVMLTILHRSVMLIDADVGAFFLVDSETAEFVVRCTYPYMPTLIGQRQSLDERGLAGFVGQSRQMEIVYETVPHPLAPENGAAMRYSIVLPIQTETALLGALRVGFSDPHTFEEDEVRVLTAVTSIALSALGRVRLVETLEQRVDSRTRDLANANHRMKQMDRLKSKFISDMSHELRTPITNLQLYGDLMAHGKAEKQERYLGIIKDQTERLAVLSEGILTMSRLDDARLSLTLKPLDMNLIAQKAIARYKEKTAVRELALQLEAAESPLFVLADDNYLPRIVDHLMDNALNYTAVGHITIRTYEGNGGNAYLSVCDSGRGIDPIDFPHLFERFYRGQEVGASNIPGSGLGLSIVKDLVDLHNGHVDIKSVLNEYTHATICIPLVEKREIETGE